jgi:hypothetical protein
VKQLGATAGKLLSELAKVLIWSFITSLSLLGYRMPSDNTDNLPHGVDRHFTENLPFTKLVKK